MRRARPEQILQTRIVARLRDGFDAVVCAVPNGGTRGRVEAVRLKESGVLAGHPDVIAYGRAGRVALIEVKAPGGSLNTAQRRVIPDLQARGFPVFVVDTVEGAVVVLRECGFEPRTPTAPSRDTGGF